MKSATDVVRTITNQLEFGKYIKSVVNERLLMLGPMIGENESVDRLRIESHELAEDLMVALARLSQIDDEDNWDDALRASANTLDWILVVEEEDGRYVQG